jgi:hypothetical protein
MRGNEARRLRAVATDFTKHWEFGEAVDQTGVTDGTLTLELRLDRWTWLALTPSGTITS